MDTAREVRVGVAKKPITDCGEGPAGKVHDELCAGVIYVEGGGAPAAMVGLDHGGLSGEDTDRAKGVLAERAGLDPDRVLVTCSHTHSALRLDPGKLGARLAEAALEARASSAPARVAFARADVGRRFSFNRRLRLSEEFGTLTIMHTRNTKADLKRSRLDAGGQVRDFLRCGANLYHQDYRDCGVEAGRAPPGPSAGARRLLESLPENIYCDGEVDPHLDALAFRRRDGAAIGTLVRFSCHPVVFYDCRTGEVSADYPGVLTREVARATGAPALFVNGACGNVRPLAAENSVSEVERMGKGLAALAIDGLSLAEARPLGRFEFARREEDFEVAPDMRGEAAGPADFEAELEKFRERASRPFDPLDLKRALDRLMRVWARGRRGERGPRRRLPICLAGFNDVAFVGLPGEIFAEASLQIKRRFPGRSVIVSELTDTSFPGYVPVREEFDRGGYEVSASRLAPGSAEKMVETASGMLESYFG